MARPKNSIKLLHLLCDYADSRQTFDKLKHQQTYKEVVEVANRLYDWKIERGRGGIYL